MFMLFNPVTAFARTPKYRSVPAVLETPVNCFFCNVDFNTMIMLIYLKLLSSSITKIHINFEESKL